MRKLKLLIFAVIITTAVTANAGNGDLKVNGTINAGVGGIRFLNGTTLHGGVTGVLDAKGWTKLPNGLIMQWGTFIIGIGTGQVADETFSIPFPNAVTSVTFTPLFPQMYVQSYVIYLRALTNTNFTAGVYSWSSSQKVYYTAIGY